MANDGQSTLPAYVIHVDQKFIAEMSHLAASYTELFAQNGRQKLIQVITRTQMWPDAPIDERKSLNFRYHSQCKEVFVRLVLP